MQSVTATLPQGRQLALLLEWKVVYSRMPYRGSLLLPVPSHSYKDTILYFTVSLLEQIVHLSHAHNCSCHRRPGLWNALEPE